MKLSLMHQAVTKTTGKAYVITEHVRHDDNLDMALATIPFAFQTATLLSIKQQAIF